MNYYPYFNGFPYMSMAQPAKAGIFKSLFGGIKWSSILNGTQKTLGIVNQALPLIQQAKPVFNNAKTMFKVMNEFKKVDTPIQNYDYSTVNTKKSETISNNNPTFFQ